MITAIRGRRFSPRGGAATVGRGIKRLSSHSRSEKPEQISESRVVACRREILGETERPRTDEMLTQ